MRGKYTYKRTHTNNWEISIIIIIILNEMNRMNYIQPTQRTEEMSVSKVFYT